MKSRFVLLAAAALLCASAQAKVSLPSFFSDNMVLQHSCDAAIWGTTDKGAVKVTVDPSWTKKKFTVTASSDGKWMMRIPTPGPGGPYTIRFSDGDKCSIGNVLIGEVWYCSGQSNMEMPMKGFRAQPVEGASKYIIGAKPSKPLRMCTIGRKVSTVPVEESKGSWKENTPEAVAGTSATAYFFATMLQETLDVPVGILICEWGGSTIEAWIKRDILESQFAGEFDLKFLDENAIPEKKLHHAPSVIFNGMVSPLIPFTFKGILWYQGEANRHREEQYTRLQPAYVKMMRELFENPDAPFYFVQIAPYKYGGGDRASSGYFYEAQEKTLSLIPNSGMAATVDIGEYGTIHPCKKQQVGERLAMLALSKTYGFTGFEAESPSFKSAVFENGKAVVSFNVGDMGLSPMGQDLTGFELAGEDRVFHPATGMVKDRVCVEVSSPEVPNPVAVRYCFKNWCVGTLYNCYGLPVLPFRSDDWEREK
ncbi:MAG: sialate O-acetylesterase [Bacteroidales bacterium]|nr:sialate O-acetylesterase [Bacteroidales bacterium]